MKAFMDKDFLLETPTAQHLDHDYAAKIARSGWAARIRTEALPATIISGD